ncbi:MAG TPA: drug/metabolite exporter YedA [Xanthomonadaceae bacterium]|nr:drug/metabolite exporter YedA [Xanthomonadaceae bacterium]
MGGLTASPVAVAAALAAVYLVWGSTYLAIAIGVQGYPPFAMGAIRMLGAGVLFYAVLRWRGVPAPTRAQWRNLAAMGVFMVLFANGLVNLAQTEVSSGLAAIAVASMPLFVAVFSTLKGRTLGRLEWTGIIVGLGGVALLNLGSELRGSWLGMVCLVIAPLSWAWGSVWSRDQDLPTPFMNAAGQMLCGGVWMALASLLLGERFTGVPPLDSTLAVIYLALFGSIIGFSAYVWLLSNVRPALATSYAYVNPAIAVLLGTLVLHERFDADTWIAMAVILASVVLVMRAPRR